MRVLMISYPFPPWGGNTKRAVLQANFLVEKGHEVHVLAVNPSRYHPLYDPTVLGLISPGVHVHRTYPGLIHHVSYRYPGLFSIAGANNDLPPLATWFRRIQAVLLNHVVFPLRTLEWLPWGLVSAVLLCWRYGFDLVYSSGDPYVTNLGGYVVKKCFRLPWVMYIGDPRYFAMFSANKPVLRQAETLCLKAADRVIVNCEETLQGYLEHFPSVPASRYAIITDGFDDALYRRIEPERSAGFRIVFTGTFYKNAREPYEFAQALQKFRPSDLEVIIAGNVSAEYKQFVYEKGLEDIIKFRGHQPYQQVVSLQKGASLLLAFGRAGGYQIPGKLFEYFGAGRPIMVVSSEVRDVASKYVLRFNRGFVIDGEATKISARLNELYELWRSGRLESLLDLRDLEEYSMASLAERFEDELVCAARML